MGSQSPIMIERSHQQELWAAGSSASTVRRKREVSTVLNSLLLLFRLPAQTMVSPTEDVSSYLN